MRKKRKEKRIVDGQLTTKDLTDLGFEKIVKEKKIISQVVFLRNLHAKIKSLIITDFI
jgi:hypothetical protein